MAECEKYQELISLYIDGNITESELTELRRHTDSCSECAGLLSVYEEVSGLMAEEQDPPAELLTGVMAGVREINARNAKAQKTRSKRVVLKWAALAACAAVILIPAAARLSGGVPTNDSAFDFIATEDSAVYGASEAKAMAPEAENKMAAYDMDKAESAVEDSILDLPESEECETPAYDPADEFAKFYAVVYLKELPEYVDETAHGTFTAADGSRAVIIDLEDLKLLMADGHEVTEKDAEAELAVAVIRP